jgi:hypothetical protein
VDGFGWEGVWAGVGFGLRACEVQGVNCGVCVLVTYMNERAVATVLVAVPEILPCLHVID